MTTFRSIILSHLTSVLVVSFCVLPSAEAYLSIAESAEVVPKNEYQVGLIPQILLNRGGGANFDAFFDMPFDESTSGRVTLGAGAVDFNAFASVKLVPFPDVDNQPAIGLRLGAGFARDESENIWLAQVAPLISKKTQTEIGLLTPYIAVPFQLVNTKIDNKSKTDTTSQFVLGSEYAHADLPEARFGAEIGFELNKSYSYISAYITLPFDSSKGFKRK